MEAYNDEKEQVITVHLRGVVLLYNFYYKISFERCFSLLQPLRKGYNFFKSASRQRKAKRHFPVATNRLSRKNLFLASGISFPFNIKDNSNHPNICGALLGSVKFLKIMSASQSERGLSFSFVSDSTSKLGFVIKMKILISVFLVSRFNIFKNIYLFFNAIFP